MDSIVKRLVFTALPPIVLTLLLALGIGVLAEERPGDDPALRTVGPQVSILPAETAVSRCEILTVTVWVTDVADLGAYEFKMDWDPAVFTVTDVVDAGFLGTTGRDVHPAGPEIDPITGTLAFAAATGGDEPGVDGSGPLAKIILEATGTGTTTLDLHDVILADLDGDPLGPPALADGTAGARKEATTLSLEALTDRVAGEPFEVAVTALDEDGLCAPTFVGSAILSDTTGTISPTEVLFSGCEATATASITQAQTNVVIQAEAQNACGATISGESAPFDVVADEGDVSSISIEPETETITAGASVTYTLTAEDVYGNPFDVTDSSAFSVPPAAGGLWTDNVYTSENAGTWPVVGSHASLSDTAQLTVTIDMDHASTVTLQPQAETVTAGQPVSFTLTAEDALGNEWDVTDEAAFSIESGAGGVWAGGVYTSENAGVWTVTGEYEGLSDLATLTVEPDEQNPVTILIEPQAETVVAGERVTYTLTAEDVYGNPWAVTAVSSFTIEAGAGGGWSDNVYTSGNPGVWSVLGSYGALSDTAVLTVVERCLAVEIESLVSDSPVKIGQAVHFTAAVTGTQPYTYTWDFGDGGAGSGLDGPTPTWTYVATGTYAVHLQVENPCGSDEAEIDVQVEHHKVYLPVITQRHGP